MIRPSPAFGKLQLLPLLPPLLPPPPLLLLLLQSPHCTILSIAFAASMQRPVQFKIPSSVNIIAVVLSHTSPATAMEDDMFGCFTVAPASKRPKSDSASAPPVPAVVNPAPISKDIAPAPAPLAHVDSSACLAADSIATRCSVLGMLPNYGLITASSLLL
jgi:hypothetical protein